MRGENEMKNLSIKTEAAGFGHVIPVLAPANEPTDDIVTFEVEGMKGVKLYFMLVIAGKCIPLLKEILLDTNISQEELLQHLKTMEYPYVLKNFKEMTDDEENVMGDYAFVLSSEIALYGAGAITSEYVKKQLYEKFKCNLIIVPTSKDSLLIFPEKYYSLEKNLDTFKFIVKINNSLDAEHPFLSNHLYYLDYDNKCFKTLD